MMNKISSLLLGVLFVLADFAPAQSVNLIGIVKTRTYTQTNASTTTAGEFLFDAFIEGDGVDATFPAASNRVTGPGGVTTNMVFDEYHWDIERSFSTLASLNSSFPNGNYTIRIGSDTFPMALSGTVTYPPVPLITASVGTWSAGRLKLTPEEAATGLTLTSNTNTGNGYLTLEIYSDTDDVLYETEINETPPSDISVDVDGSALTPGVVYTAELEFDQVTDFRHLSAYDWAGEGATAFALFSSRTIFEIQIVSPQLEVLGNNTLIENGALTPNLADHTDFGALLVSQSMKRTFTIRNSGTADLTVDAVSIVGPDASQFSVLKQPSANVSPGGSTTFEIIFEPALEGELSASVSFSTNDTANPTFEMAIAGTGKLPAVLDFETQPENQLILLGSTATLTALAAGDDAISYQWKKGGVPISGARSATLTLPDFKVTDVGSYSVVADSPFAEPMNSQIAYLGVVTPVSERKILKRGDKLTLTCTARAPSAAGVSLSYAWRRESGVLENGTQENGAIVSGQDKATLTISKIQEDDSDDYVCEVTLNTLNPDDIDPVLEHGLAKVEVVGAVPELDFGNLPEEVSVSELMGPEVMVKASNSPTGFSVKNLPAGLKLDTKTGKISGRPTTPSKKDKNGAYIPQRIAFKASNPIGSSREAFFNMVILPLEASFVGTFYGVIAREGASNFNLGGHLQITVAKTGAISGSATLAGQKHSVTGSLNASPGNEPTAQLLIKRKPSSLGNLNLTLNIVRNGDMQGQIYDSRFEKVSGALILGNAAEAGDEDGPAEDARFSSPGGIAVLPNGDAYIADTGNHRIRLVTEGGNVSTIAGTAEEGQADGLGTASSFRSPEGLALDAEGNLYVADTGNSTIRRVSPAGAVTTYAGAAGEVGNVNGSRLAARFNQPCGLCFDPAGNLYVVERGSHAIRKITKAGLVSTFAGKPGLSGHKDASGLSALFNRPHGIVYEPLLKALFVTDTQNYVIRKVTLTGKVSTYAGSPGINNVAEGLLANTRWLNPTGITTRGDGSLIVGDGLLCQINPNGVMAEISEPLDESGFADNPVALAYLPQNKSILSVHNTLHGITRHQGSDLAEEREYFRAEFVARRQFWSSARLVPERLRGTYNAAISEAMPLEELPRGHGYARLSISKTGTASWTGKTAEGASFTSSSFLAGDLDSTTYFVPMHGVMHKNTASLQGECFIDGESLDVSDDNTPAFDWHKIAQPLRSTDRSYRNGFAALQRRLTGGKYVPGNIHRFLSLEGSPATLNLDLAEGGLSAPIATTFRITSPNSVTAPSGMALKIDTKTGIFTGSFTSGTPAVTASFTGVLLQNSASAARGGYGYFLRPTSTVKTAPFLSGSVRF